MRFLLSGYSILIATYFAKTILVVIQTIRAFQSGKIRADCNRCKILGKRLVIADSTFERIFSFHFHLLFNAVVV